MPKRVTSPRPKRNKVPSRSRMAKGSKEAKEWSRMMLEKKRQKKMQREKDKKSPKRKPVQSKKVKSVPFANNTTDVIPKNRIKSPGRSSKK
jgi:hypothetical protein